MAPGRKQRSRRDLGLEQLLATRHARERRLRRRRRSVLSIVALLVAAILVLVLAAAALTGQSILDSTCSLKDLRPLSAGSNTILYASDHSRLGVVPSSKNRQPLPLSKMSPWLRKATVAIEDARFYQHDALDLQGIARAFIQDLTSGQIKQGGSTLTQQLVRNLYIGNQEKSLKRKLKEACLADKEFSRMQDEYGKRARARILAAYLNQVFYGESAYGVEAAARTYFSRHASDLNLSQAALIAGLPQAPSVYNPFGPSPTSQQDALHRRNDVLRAMLKNHYISHGEFRLALHKPLGLKKGHLYTRIQQPNFFGWATKELNKRFGRSQVDHGGLTVTTTLDPRLQALALSAAKNVLHTSTDPATAIVAIDPRNGAVKAMVDWFPDGRHRNFNDFHLATDAHRSTGSAFKPITLATALNEGASLYSTFTGPPEIYINDPQCRTNNGPWDVHNSGDESAGTMDLIHATASSVNTIFAQLISLTGINSVMRMAKWMGITSTGRNFPPVCAMTLGSVGFTPLELTDVYATIASGGIHHAPQAFETVRGPNKKLLGKISTTGRSVLAPNLAAQLTYAMTQVVQYGTGVAAAIPGRPVAGKTGTAENYQDAWFCGFVPQLATCVWIGYPAGEIPLLYVEGVGTVFGGTLPAQIWRAFMEPAVAPLPVKTFPTPDLSGGRYWSSTYGTTWEYAPGSYPVTPSTTTSTTTTSTTTATTTATH